MDLTASDIDRFWAKVDVRGPDDCWLWTAACKPAGYGQLMKDGQPLYAHRISQVLASGPIPEGMYVHHRCETKACVNPAHLENVTPSGHNWIHPHRTGCKKHGETYMRRGPKSGVRYCYVCNRTRMESYLARKAARQ